MFFFSNLIYGQTYFKDYLSLKKEDKELLKSVDSILTLVELHKDYLQGGKITHHFAIQLFLKKQYSDALNYSDKEVEYFELIKVENVDYVKALFNSGLYSLYNYQYEEAIDYSNRVIKLNLDERKTAQAYGTIGKSLYGKGQFLKSIFFLKKSILGLKKVKAYRNLFSDLSALSRAYYRIEGAESIREGLKIISEMDDLRSYMKFTPRMNMRVNEGYANFYAKLENEYINKSIKFYKKNLIIAKTFQDTSAIGLAYGNLSNVYNIKKSDSAFFYVKQSLKYLKKDKINLAICYRNYSESYLMKGEFEKALKMLDSSLLVNLSLEDFPNSIPTEAELRKANNKRNVLLSLKMRGEIFLKSINEENNFKNIRQTIENVNVVSKLAGILLDNTNEDRSRLLWQEEASQAYLYGAYASHLLGDSEKAFSFMEKNKALLLSEGILKNTEFANLPKHISDEETKLKKQVYELENELSKNEDNSVLQDSLFNAKLYHEKYVDSLKAVYPKYFARKVEVIQVPLKEVKKEIKNNQTIVSYIWNEFDRDKELIIGFVTTKDKSITFKVKDVEELKKQIKKYQNLVSKPFSTKEEQEDYKETAYKLYQSLFPNQEVQDLIKGKNLLIIPDGNIQNIPFESLITEENSNDYLILNGNVNYSYSYSFLKHNEKVERKTTEDFIGYSPVNFQTDSLSNLNNSKEEVQAINAEFNGVSKLQDTATKEDFLNNSKSSKIIHLATHADAGENPWIAFADKKLELHELYTYKNNADLVTLSACNTSLGEVAKGEGVLSLARGFFYSGSKSVVSSLWEVNDKSTSEIMTNFYKNLKEGQTKSEAINKAKRDYLKAHSLSEQSPYYWSSFILIGDAGEVDLGNNYYLYFLLAAFILLILIFFRKKIKIFG